jgi:toxin ParE1/3/4
MTLPILWKPQAREDLAKIIAYVAERNQFSALALLEAIEAATIPSASYPYLFRPGRVAGTREIVAHPNYIVVYRVTASTIEVINVIHARRQYPG